MHLHNSRTVIGLTIGARVNDWGLAQYSGAISAVRLVCTSALDMAANVTITQFTAYKGYEPPSH